MNFWIEWALAVHRAIWFPLNWTMGFERPGIELPVEFAPAIAGATDAPPPLKLIEGGLGMGSAPGRRTRHTLRRKKKLGAK